MDTLKTNVLYYGDNLQILRKYIPDNSINLIYLAPPFNSNKGVIRIECLRSVSE